MNWLSSPLPLWLVPALPLAGFLVNGLVALALGARRAAKASAAWRAKHGSSGHDDDTIPNGVRHDAHPAAHTALDEPAGDAHGHGGHGSGPALPWGERLFHGLVGVVSVGLAGVVAFANLVPYAQEVIAKGSSPAVVQRAYTWIFAGGFSVDVAFRLDALSALMLAFVTFVATLIHVYSVGYMQNEEGYGRFFAYLNLFMFAMLTLVLADSLPVLFIGWEGVGLCSYLLIGYYYDKDFAAAAGKKAFVANRIGDLGMVLGIFGVLALFGTTDFSFVTMARHHLTSSAGAGAPLSMGSLSVYAVCLLLFLGACGKSAQVPLYVWLPDAMAGPTPVSALIHAATMVTAGVYLVARCSALFLLAPDAMTLVAWVGCGTALFAATIGLAQNDIKKVLAYSTVSQLGYMFLACGLGAFAAGMFHVFTHAFFKACLFLGSGSVIHAMGGEQDMRRMGGLKSRTKQTFLTMAVATVAIAGIVPFAGFFSKDQILGAAFAEHKVLWLLGLATAGMTAFYMTRLMAMTFFGTFRGTAEEEHHLHESPATMTIPLWILGAGSVLAGFVGIPAALGGSNLVVRFLEPSVGAPLAEEVSHQAELLAMVVALLIAVGGIVWAFRWYARHAAAVAAGTPVAQIAVSAPAEAFYTKTGALGPIVANKWNVDEGIERLVLSPFRKIGTFLWRGFDALFIDGIANASAFLVELSGDLLRFFTTGNVRNYALGFSLGVLVLLAWVWVR